MLKVDLHGFIPNFWGTAPARVSNAAMLSTFATGETEMRKASPVMGKRL